MRRRHGPREENPAGMPISLLQGWFQDSYSACVAMAMERTFSCDLKTGPYHKANSPVTGCYRVDAQISTWPLLEIFTDSLKPGSMPSVVDIKSYQATVELSHSLQIGRRRPSGVESQSDHKKKWVLWLLSDLLITTVTNVRLLACNAQSPGEKANTANRVTMIARWTP